MLKQALKKCRDKVDCYLMTSNNIGIITLDSKLRILDSNRRFTSLFNCQQNPVGEPLSNFIELGCNNVRCEELLKVSCSRNTGMVAVNDCYLIQADDGYLLFLDRPILTESRALEQMGCIHDELIDLQREAVRKNQKLLTLQRELDKRVAELEATLARVKQLEGIIPICTLCKKIRDDKNSWQQLEEYLSDHSEAQFSHGLCPSCGEEQMKIYEAFIEENSEE